MSHDALIKKIDEYFRSRPEVAAAYLFGSYAADTQKPESDADIGILFYHELAERFSDYEDLNEFIKQVFRHLGMDAL